MLDQFNGIVQYNPLKGLKWDGRSNVSRDPLGLRVFLDRLNHRFGGNRGRQPFDDLMNIGSADGYYFLGLLKAGVAKRYRCFEITERCRTAIKRNAEKMSWPIE